MVDSDVSAMSSGFGLPTGLSGPEGVLECACPPRVMRWGLIQQYDLPASLLQRADLALGVPSPEDWPDISLATGRAATAATAHRPMSTPGFEGFYRDGWLEDGLLQQYEIIGTGGSVSSALTGDPPD